MKDKCDHNIITDIGGSVASSKAASLYPNSKVKEIYEKGIILERSSSFCYQIKVLKSIWL